MADYPVGPKGPKGDPGPIGPRGNQGPKGDKGEPGDRGERGYSVTGPEGPQGQKGDQGDQGIRGVKGDTGDQGVQGPKGARGDRGPKGDRGERGPSGFTYIQGEGDGSGVPGPQGPQGDPGPKGDPGDPATIPEGLLLPNENGDYDLGNHFLSGVRAIGGLTEAPLYETDATNKRYVDNSLEDVLHRTESGDVDMQGKGLYSVSRIELNDPQNDNWAANKRYVDAQRNSKLITEGSWDSVTTPGLYHGHGLTNNPTSDDVWYSITVMGADASWCQQVAVAWFSKDIYSRRRKEPDGWKPWVRQDSLDVLRKQAGNLINLDQFVLANVHEPYGGTDAATKGYVDAFFAHMRGTDQRLDAQESNDMGDFPAGLVLVDSAAPLPTSYPFPEDANTSDAIVITMSADYGDQGLWKHQLVFSQNAKWAARSFWGGWTSWAINVGVDNNVLRREPTGYLSMWKDGQRHGIFGLTDPENADDAATKGYVDSKWSKLPILETDLTEQTAGFAIARHSALPVAGNCFVTTTSAENFAYRFQTLVSETGESWNRNYWNGAWSNWRPATNGLEGHSPLYSLPAKTTIYVPDADIPRDATVTIQITGDAPGPLTAQMYRNGAYNVLDGKPLRDNWWQVGGSAPIAPDVSPQSTGDYMFGAFIESQDPGARLGVRNGHDFPRSCRIFWRVATF